MRKINKSSSFSTNCQQYSFKKKSLNVCVHSNSSSSSDGEKSAQKERKKEKVSRLSLSIWTTIKCCIYENTQFELCIKNRKWKIDEIIINENEAFACKQKASEWERGGGSFEWK